MNGIPQDYMTLGVVQPKSVEEKSVLETLDALRRDDYFQSFEVTSIEDSAIRKEAAALAKSASKVITLGTQPLLSARKLSLNSLDRASRQTALDAVRACIAQAKECEAKFLTVVSSPAAENKPLAAAMLLASLKELCEISRRTAGPAILLEVFAGASDSLIPTASTAEDIAVKVGVYFDRFGLAVNLSKLSVGDAPEYALKQILPYVRQIYISPFEAGEQELPTLLRILLETGYNSKEKKNLVTLRLDGLANVAVGQAVESARQALDAAWKKL